MIKIQADWLQNAKTRFDKCYCLAKLLGKMLLKKGMSAHVYEYTYSPKRRSWDTLPCGNVYENIISRNKDVYFKYVKDCSQFIDNFKAIPFTTSKNASEPFWSNSFFPPLDAISLYGLIAQKKPAVYMEVGSGNSTKFARRAISDHGLDTKIISVDPYPRAEIDSLCDEVLRVCAETLPVERFAALNSGDVLFIDNSHRSFQNSDVTFFFTEILPNLRPGVIYGMHDIFLPNDYPESWAMRFYNEQYLLMSYLLGGAGGDEILFPVAYMSGREEVKAALQAEDEGNLPWGKDRLYGGAFWMVKA